MAKWTLISAVKLNSKCKFKRKFCCTLLLTHMNNFNVQFLQRLLYYGKNLIKLYWYSLYQTKILFFLFNGKKWNGSNSTTPHNTKSIYLNIVSRNGAWLKNAQNQVIRYYRSAKFTDLIDILMVLFYGLTSYPALALIASLGKLYSMSSFNWAHFLQFCN